MGWDLPPIIYLFPDINIVMYLVLLPNSAYKYLTGETNGRGKRGAKGYEENRGDMGDKANDIRRVFSFSSVITM